MPPDRHTRNRDRWALAYGQETWVDLFALRQIQEGSGNSEDL